MGANNKGSFVRGEDTCKLKSGWVVRTAEHLLLGKMLVSAGLRKNMYRDDFGDELPKGVGSLIAGGILDRPVGKSAFKEYQKAVFNKIAARVSLDKGSVFKAYINLKKMNYSLVKRINADYCKNFLDSAYFGLEPQYHKGMLDPNVVVVDTSALDVIRQSLADQHNEMQSTITKNKKETAKVEKVEIEEKKTTEAEDIEVVGIEGEVLEVREYRRSRDEDRRVSRRESRDDYGRGDRRRGEPRRVSDLEERNDTESYANSLNIPKNTIHQLRKLKDELIGATIDFRYLNGEYHRETSLIKADLMVLHEAYEIIRETMTELPRKRVYGLVLGFDSCFSFQDIKDLEYEKKDIVISNRRDAYEELQAYFIKKVSEKTELSEERIADILILAYKTVLVNELLTLNFGRLPYIKCVDVRHTDSLGSFTPADINNYVGSKFKYRFEFSRPLFKKEERFIKIEIDNPNFATLETCYHTNGRKFVYVVFKGNFQGEFNFKLKLHEVEVIQHVTVSLSPEQLAEAEEAAKIYSEVFAEPTPEVTQEENNLFRIYADKVVLKPGESTDVYVEYTDKIESDEILETKVEFNNILYVNEHAFYNKTYKFNVTVNEVGNAIVRCNYNGNTLCLVLNVIEDKPVETKPVLLAEKEERVTLQLMFETIANVKAIFNSSDVSKAQKVEIMSMLTEYFNNIVEED